MRRLIDFFLSGSDNPQQLQFVRWMWRLAIGGVAAVFFLFIILSFTKLPSVQQLENPQSELASQVFGTNGEVIGRYYTENRVPVSYEDLSPNVIRALLSTEDVRFYEHSGIDFKALGRVAIKTVILQDRSSGGASTISQQLAKLLFTGQVSRNTLSRVAQKLKEWIIAVRLERKYTKEEIIAMYLNTVPFIHEAYGIKAAAETFFGKPQDSLSVTEAATLVGMLKNPALYNPLRRPELVEKRREVVLSQMEKNGFLSREEYDRLRVAPLGVNYRPKTHIDGIATYFRMELAKDVKDILSREENLKSDGTPYNLYRDGLKIYTTIDPDLQRMAEEAMVEHMANTQKILWREWKGRDPWTTKTNSQTEIPVEIRLDELNKMVRATDRYQVLRDKYLSEVLTDLEQEFPNFTFNTDDREIDRMVSDYEKPGVISDLVDRKLISAALASSYRRVMRSAYFPRLRTAWQQLQEASRQAMSTPTPMKVFSYDTPTMEKDTVLTPMDSIKYHRMFLQTGMLAVDPRTGQIKVWVGGINHKYFQYDNIRSNRQVGSSFKHFVYATAIAQMGFSPCYQVYDMATTIAAGEGNFGLLSDWTPRNFSEKYSGRLLTLKEGLRQSTNTVSVHLMKQLGDTEPVRGLIHNMGIDSSSRYPNGRLRVPQSPAICLGATDLTVMEMTGAYTSFANNGIFNKPVYILRIEDKNGRVIYEGMQEERRALQPNANYVMVEMLRYSGNVGGVKSDVGGKTGTTNDFSDGWFMGITPNLVVGTWVGGEDRWIHFRSSTYGQGSRMAKPFFISFMKRVESTSGLDYDPSARFFRPPGDLGIELDCSKYRGGIKLNPESEEDSFSEDPFGDESVQEDPFQRR